VDRRRLAGDVEAVVKALGLKRVILVGHSMGRLVALLAANRMPGTVVAVIGVDTLQNAEFKLPEEVRKSILDGVEKDFKGTVRVTFAGLLPEKADAELKQWLQAKAEGQEPKMALALLRDLFGLDTVAAFKEAKVPVRCINSAGGYQSFTPTAVETNKKYADFGAVTIEGVGHYPMAGEAGRVQPQTPGRAQGVCDQEVTPSRPVRGTGRKDKRSSGLLDTLERNRSEIVTSVRDI
jgi:sigma-B regulation protein RsbQ